MVTTRAKRAMEEDSVSTQSQKQAKEESMVKEETIAKEATPKETTPQDPSPDLVNDSNVYEDEYDPRAQEYYGLMQEHFHMLRCGAVGWAVGRKDLYRHCLGLRIQVRSWANQWGARKPQDMERLSDDQKQAIIRSLKGSCVQEDWNVLLSRLPESIRRNIADILLQTLVLREVHTQLLEPPFWYLDGKKAPDDQDDDTFSQRLQYLYQKFTETNPISAALWRSETIRLANSVMYDQAPNTSFGRYNERRRFVALPGMVDKFLASEPIAWLLREVADKKEESIRTAQMLSIFKDAAEFSPIHLAERGCLEYKRRLEDFDETFTEGSYKMQAHHYHFGDRTRLNGRRILLIVHPAITRNCHSFSHVLESVVCSKAYVVVEDPADPTETVLSARESGICTEADAMVEAGSHTSD